MNPAKCLSALSSPARAIAPPPAGRPCSQTSGVTAQAGIDNDSFGRFALSYRGLRFAGVGWFAPGEAFAR